MTESFTITDLAQEFDITTRAIRFYEDQGLLSPQRKGQQRIYAPRDRTRLKLILRGKRLGFSLSEVGEMIELYDTESGESGQLNLFLDKIRERRAALRGSRRNRAGRGVGLHPNRVGGVLVPAGPGGVLGHHPRVPGGARSRRAGAAAKISSS